MSSTVTTHPHITKTPGVKGGSACLEGTGFPVISVVGYVLQLGMKPEELVRDFPYLTLAQIYSALSYYYDNKAELDREIYENSEEYWREKAPHLFRSEGERSSPETS
jgi:uncharacterized protein (DUF433 family)